MERDSRVEGQECSCPPTAFPSCVEDVVAQAHDHRDGATTAVGGRLLRGLSSIAAPNGIVRPVSAHRLLVALEAAIREGDRPITTGYEIHQLAWTTGLCKQPDTQAARWTGYLVDQGWLEFGPSHHPRPPRGVPWSDGQLQAFHNYVVTSDGSAEAQRVRQIDRERLIDELLGIGWPALASAPEARRALLRPLDDLRRALEDSRTNAAIGAAKEVLESAARIRLRDIEESPRRDANLSALVKAAAEQGSSSAIAHRAAALAEAISEHRNRVGAGHGRSAEAAAELSSASLAAGIAVALARYLLADPSPGDQGSRP